MDCWEDTSLKGSIDFLHQNTNQTSFVLGLFQMYNLNQLYRESGNFSLKIGLLTGRGRGLSSVLAREVGKDRTPTGSGQVVGPSRGLCTTDLRLTLRTKVVPSTFRP